MKKWYASKTIQFALLKILTGVGAAISTGTVEPLILAATAVVDIILRSVTNTPIRGAEG
jgi:hypothetical protein